MKIIIILILVGLVVVGVFALPGLTEAPLEVIDQENVPAETVGNDIALVEEGMEGEVRLTAVSKVGEGIVQVTGVAPGTWYFEANIRVAVEDTSGNTLGESGGMAKDEWMTVEDVEFSATIEYLKSSTRNGFIVVRNDNPSGLPENEKVAKFPIIFK